MRTGLATTFDELLCRRPPVSGTDVEGSPAAEQQPPKQNTAAVAQQRPSGALRKTAESSTTKSSVGFRDLLCERSEKNEGNTNREKQILSRSRSHGDQKQAAQIASRPGVTDDAVEAQQIEEEEAFDEFPPKPLLQTFPQTIRRGPVPNQRKSVPTRNPVMDNRESRRMLPLLIPKDGAGGSAKQRSANQDMARGPQAGMPKKKPTRSAAADDADPFKAFLRDAASTDASTNKNESRHYDLRKKLERQKLLEKVTRPRPTDEWLYEMRTYYMGAAHEEMMKAMTRENVCRTSYLEHTVVPRSVDVPEVMEMTNMCKEWRKAFKIKTKAEEAKERREAEKKEKQEAEKQKMMDFMGDSGVKGNLKK